MDLSCVTAADALPACATLDDACGWGEAGSGSSGGGPAVAAGSIGDTECRLGMADVFWGHFNYLKASGNSTDIQDLPICLTDEGKPSTITRCFVVAEAPWLRLHSPLTVQKLEGPPVSLSEMRSMFCRAGLANGAINMVAGMVIVAATVLLGGVEQISGMYAIRSPRGVVVVVSPAQTPAPELWMRLH